MRGKLISVLLCFTIVFFLSSCTQVITSSADEIRMFRWRGEFENGNTAELSFEDTNGCFTVSFPDETMKLSGLCVTTDDRLIICDEESGMNYTFGYRLYGDRVELSCNGAWITLNKL